MDVCAHAYFSKVELFRDVTRNLCGAELDCWNEFLILTDDIWKQGLL